jgi:iron complex transport system substrate-binding protein
VALSISRGPRRIVCLTEEPTEILYQLGEQDRIVGISAYTVRPPEARRDKPIVSAFVGGSVKKICALAPDLVIGFSDIQADLAKQLIAQNLQVLIFNQRSVQEILDVIVSLGRLVDRQAQAEALVGGYIQRLEHIATRAARRLVRPRVYFEEWDEPQISAIAWVSELIGVAGGDDVFPERAACAMGRDRILADPLEVARRAPDIIVGSWCGKKFRPDRVAARPGWEAIPAVRDGEIHEVKSPLILQPGPAALTDGLDALHGIVSAWAQRKGKCAA